jgi:hypothetical protein
MMIQIAMIILQDFAKDPVSIGIVDITYLLDQKDEITNEVEATVENFDVLNQVIKFLGDS